MGFWSPFTIRGKILLQEMWISGLDWDEEVSKKLLVKMISWFSELPSWSQIKVPRSLQLQKIVWEKECAACKRKKAKNAQQIMAPLPLHRLMTSMRAFTRTAVDYGGLFVTMQGRGRKREKRYLCLFYMFNIMSCSMCSFGNGPWPRCWMPFIECLIDKVYHRRCYQIMVKT